MDRAQHRKSAITYGRGRILTSRTHNKYELDATTHRLVIKFIALPLFPGIGQGHAEEYTNGYLVSLL